MMIELEGILRNIFAPLQILLYVEFLIMIKN